MRMVCMLALSYYVIPALRWPMLGLGQRELWALELGFKGCVGVQ